jgi:cellulose synthase/poly-beta-1,6-N-acetylglucosamine synthase-like glycosyltransferase
VYQAIGGFNNKTVAGEDYDFQSKLNKGGYKCGYVDAEALHMDEPKDSEFFKLMKKFYKYGKDSVNFINENPSDVSKQIVRRVYLKHWKKLITHPFMTICFVLYMTSKFTAGGLGMLSALVEKNILRRKV